MDWKQIIRDIVASGMTQAQIGHHVGVKQSTIAGLVSGGQQSVRWEIGDKLLSLHRERCDAGDAAANAPTTASAREAA